MKSIVVGIDFSDVTGDLLSTAGGLAKSFGATVYLVHIYAPEPAFVGYAAYTYPGEDERAEELKEEKRQLRELVNGLRNDGIEAQAYMKEGDTLGGLLEFAEHRDADVIVLGTHGHNFMERVLLGSVAEGVVREARIPVMVVPAPGKKK